MTQQHICGEHCADHADPHTCGEPQVLTPEVAPVGGRAARGPAGSDGDVGGVGATFGNLNVQYTLSRYRAMARRAGLVPVVERNITRNTLPTYSYLQSLIGSARTPRRGIGMLRLLARTRLLSYYLLAFRRPPA